MYNICIELHIATVSIDFNGFKNIFFAEIKVLISYIAHHPNMNLEKRTTPSVFLDEKKYIIR